MTWALVTRTRLAAVALFVLAGLAPALALNVQPLVLDMVAVGAHARGVIQVVNDSAAPLPVEVAIKKLDIAFDGKTSDSAAGNEFLVFPPQAVVPPGATQSFRIQWVGEPNIQKSQTYMFSVNQLPVKRKAGESGVQVAFSFGVIVSVAPPGAQSAMTLLGAEAATEGGKRGAAITVENSSSMYSYFTDAGVVLESGGWRKVLSSAELRQTMGYGVVLPGKKRRFFLPADVPAGAGKITAVLDYKPRTAK